MASVYSPADATVKISVQTGTDSGGKAILRTISFSKCAASVTADKVAAFSAAVGTVVEPTIRITSLQRVDTVEPA